MGRGEGEEREERRGGERRGKRLRPQ